MRSSASPCQIVSNSKIRLARPHHRIEVEADAAKVWRLDCDDVTEPEQRRLHEDRNTTARRLSAARDDPQPRRDAPSARTTLNTPSMSRRCACSISSMVLMLAGASSAQNETTPDSGREVRLAASDMMRARPEASAAVNSPTDRTPARYRAPWRIRVTRAPLDSSRAANWAATPDSSASSIQWPAR